MLNGILRSCGTRLAAIACIGLFAAAAASTVEHPSPSHPQAAASQPSSSTDPGGVFGWD